MVNHSEFYNDDGLSGWWSGSTSIRRSIFMGDYIYAFSAAGASVHRTGDLTSMVELELPGYDEPQAYYYETEDEVESEDSGGSDGEAPATAEG